MKVFTIHIENPFKTWWKARKYFKFPKPKITFFCHRVGKAKLIDIDIHDIYWKDKWNSPRHEISPRIFFCLFRTIGFVVNFPVTYSNEFGDKENYDMEYWEYLLDYLYYSKSLNIDSWWTKNSRIFTVLDKIGKAEDGSEDTRKPLTLAIPTHLFSLNKRGLKEFKKLYVEKRNT